MVEQTDSERRTAAGEVLGGTISDAMLPLDTVRSQAPSAVVTSDSGSGEPGNGAATPASGTEAGEAERVSTPDETEPEAEAAADEDAA